MLFEIQINDEVQVEADNKTNAFKHYLNIHPDKKITLVYHGCTHDTKTTR